MKEKESRSIFSNIVKDENSMTELLCNFLHHKRFRDILFSSFLNKNETELINNEDIKTQEILPLENGRPDLIVDNGAINVLFEIKTGNASLTRNQPTSYLKHLSDMPGKKWLIFILPKNYFMLDHLKDKAKLFLKRHPNTRIKTSYIYWEDIIDILKKHDLDDSHEAFVDFLGLLQNKFIISKVILDREEVNIMYDKKSGQTLAKFYKAIEQIKNKYNDTYDISPRRNQDDYGLSFKNKEGAVLFYVGIWYGFWAEHGWPICFGIELKNVSKQQKQRFLALHKGKCAPKMDGWLMSWIEKKELLSGEKDLVKHLTKVIDKELRSLRIEQK